MTILHNRPTGPVAPLNISWTSPDANLWVATIDGDYAGMIEFKDGHFVVQSHAGEQVATCTSIPAAQSALATHARSLTEPAAVRMLGAFVAAAPARAFLDRRPRAEYMRKSTLDS